MKKFSLIFVSLAFLIACSTSKNTNTSTIEVKKTTEDSLDLTKLEAGKNLYSEKCTVCHKMKNPANFSKEEMSKIVPKMVYMANKRETNITPEEESLISYFAVANAK